MPKGKRNHGYFVLPILFGEEIVGRLDPKAERKSKTFLVRQLNIGPKFHDADGLIPELGRALGRTGALQRLPNGSFWKMSSRKNSLPR